MKKDVFDELIVVKRSGQRVNFNSYKIAIAIKSAYDNVYGDYDPAESNHVYEKVLDHIEKNYDGRKTINVEDIQDIIENTLKEEKKQDVYMAFSEYRRKRAESRKVFKIKQQHKFAKAMEKIAEEDLIRSENAYSPDEILIKCGRTVMSEYSKAYLIDSKFLRAHEEGKIYIHDIDGFPLGKLSHTHLMLDEAIKSDSSIDNLIFSILSSKTEINGEVNIPAIDFLLDPWLKDKHHCYFKEFLTNYLRIDGFDEYINVKKAYSIVDKKDSIDFDIDDFESLQLSDRVAHIFASAQTDAICKIKCIINRKIQKIFKNLEKNEHCNPYYSLSFGTNDTSSGRLINDAIIENIKNNEPYKNLKFIFKLDSLSNRYLDKISAIIASKKDIYIASSRALEDTQQEYFANGRKVYGSPLSEDNTSKGKMVVGTTSINMCRTALESPNDMKEFYRNLDETLELVKNELLLTFETIGNKSKENYHVLFNGNIASDEKLLPGQKIRKVIKGGTLNIGLVGLKECVMILETDKDRQYDLLIEILNYIGKKCTEFSNSTKLNFAICEPVETRVAKNFIEVDKTIYGIKKGITENSKYDLVSNLPIISSDYNRLSKISSLFTGGNMIEIAIPKNATENKIKNMIEKIYKANIEFVLFTDESWYERCK